MWRSVLPKTPREAQISKPRKIDLHDDEDDEDDYEGGEDDYDYDNNDARAKQR